MNTLNITNGDCAVDIMKESGINGTFLPWRDVLHEGPVPTSLSLEALSEVRAQYIFNRGWISSSEVASCFKDRDKVITSFSDYDQVILCFEHDLYDQLQLIQILDWFADQQLDKTALRMICIDRYLGMLSPAEMSALVEEEKEVTQTQLTLAKKAWSAFCAPSPTAWHALLNENTVALPFLDGAIIRLLEEYPNKKNGLSRTAHETLKILASNNMPAGKLFELYINTEERKFLGNTSFWCILREMLGTQPALMTLPKNIELTLPTKPEQVLSITPAGHDILAGKLNWLDLIQVDYWLGGVHQQKGNTWCWDSKSKKIIKSTQ